MNDPTTSGDPPRAPAPSGRRFLAVDALRGFDMFWIVGGGGLVHAVTELGDTSFLRAVHDQLDHVEWRGFAFLDLIFPLFVFLAGMSVTFSIPALVERAGRAAAWRRILTRSAVIFLLGIFYYGGLSKPFAEVRILGVLQRIAICYLATSVLFLYLRPRALAAVLVALLLGYWAAMALVPVPGVGAGSWEMGRNLANYLDSAALPGRKWDGTWDPEGLLSTVPAIGTCLLGALAGLAAKDAGTSEGRKVLGFLVAGAALAALGWGWSAWVPVVKKIWTPSYVLVAGGYSLILLGLFWLVVEVWRLRAWATPLVWIGANPLAIYMADDIASFEGIAKRLVGGDVKAALGPWGELALQAVALAAMFALAGFLYRRKIFLRA